MADGPKPSRRHDLASAAIAARASARSRVWHANLVLAVTEPSTSISGPSGAACVRKM
jgi:hypothetical protein